MAAVGALAAAGSLILATYPRRAGAWTPKLSLRLRRRLSHGVPAGLWIRPLCAGAVGALAYLAFGLAAPAVVLAALGWSVASAIQGWRRRKVEAQLRAALLSAVDLLAQLLPAGQGTRQALAVLASGGPLVLRPELARILARLDRVPLETALAEAQGRIHQPLFDLIAATLTVGSRSGGRLVPLLAELSRASHQIDAAQSQLRAEQAQGRMGALVIGLMPIALLLVLRAVNPQYLAPYASSRGELVLGAALGLIVLGYLWMLRILRLPAPDVVPLASVSWVGRAPALAEGGLSFGDLPVARTRR
ncbi:MAG: type II secretion system F family protein [Candidatus Dormibacteria bacterium]